LWMQYHCCKIRNDFVGFRVQIKISNTLHQQLKAYPTHWYFSEILDHWNENTRNITIHGRWLQGSAYSFHQHAVPCVFLLETLGSPPT
jgi:hypothetical protein